MSVFNIFILMVLMHVIDDFVLQPVCLSKLKQEKWWMEECKKQDLPFKKYEDDFIAALFCHSASWSAMILLPIIFWMPNCEWLCVVWLLNTLTHSLIDNLKANDLKLNLVQDQLLHLAQICITLIVIMALK